MDNKQTFKAYAAFASISFFWGTTYLAIRIGVEVMPPALLAGLRFIIAGLLFLGWLVIRGHKIPGGRAILDIMIVAVALLTIANGAVVYAEQWVPSGFASLIIATLPLMMVIMLGFMKKGEHLTRRKIGGIILGFAGIVLLVWPDLQADMEPDYLKGIIILFIAPVAWGAGTLYAKYHQTSIEPKMAAAMQMLVGGILLLCISALAGEFPEFYFSWQGMAALWYLIVFGSFLGYGCYIYALQHLQPSVVSTYTYINPVVAVFLGWLILNERLDGHIIVSTLVILAGVILVKTSPGNTDARSGPVNASKVKKTSTVEQAKDTMEAKQLEI
jgi:drug/metabolite transporter (DMT)-like permease